MRGFGQAFRTALRWERAKELGGHVLLTAHAFRGAKLNPTGLVRQRCLSARSRIPNHLL